MYLKDRLLNRFYDLLQESVLIQFYITIAFVTVSCILWLTGNTLPETLRSLLLIVIGFYFGRKIGVLSTKGENK